MKKFSFVFLFFLCILCVFQCQVQAANEKPDVHAGYDVDGIISDLSADEIDILRGILVCVRDIDLYIQFLVIIGFAVGLTYFVILKPIRIFLR